MGDTGNNEQPVGLDALQARLDEIAMEGDTSEQEEQEVAAPENEATEEAKVEEPKEEEQPEPKAEAKEESEGETEEKAEPEQTAEDTAEEGETYKPTYQYKFQDQMHEFDDRVKAAIKTKEDEEYFKDLYTRASAMDLMKGRAEETQAKLQQTEASYNDVKQRFEETDKIVNYWSGLLEGINRGDAQSFQTLLNLAQVDGNTLAKIGQDMVGLLNNIDQYEAQRNAHVSQAQQQQAQQQQTQLQSQNEEVEVARTDLEIKRALMQPEISEVAKMVDEKWGEGSFEDMVWSQGSAMQAQNPNMSLKDIPALVSQVADKFRAFQPASQPATQQAAPQDPAKQRPAPQAQRVVKNNTTTALPNVSGEQGVPVKPIYQDGTGLDGLRKRHKEITGEEW